MSLSDSGVFRSFIASSTEIDKLSMIARTELIFLLNDLRSVQPSQFFSTSLHMVVTPCGRYWLVRTYNASLHDQQ